MTLLHYPLSVLGALGRPG